LGRNDVGADAVALVVGPEGNDDDDELLVIVVVEVKVEV
jgi:hypothetical protein